MKMVLIRRLPCLVEKRVVWTPAVTIGTIVLLWSLFSWSVFATDNLIVNGSFDLPSDDDGLPVGWTVFSGEPGKDMWIQADAGMDGGPALVFDSGGRGNLGLRSELVPVHPGDVFEASVVVRPTPGNRPALRLEYLDEHHQRVDARSVNAPPGGKWETLTVRMQAPENAKTVSIVLFSSAVFNPGQSVFDHASLSKGMPYVVDVSTDRPDALYSINEDVTFIVRVQQGGRPVNDASVEWLVTMDGVDRIGFGISRLTDGEARVTQRLDRPGFLRMEATVTGSGGRQVVTVAAGVDPHHIGPSMPPPDDFDVFWDGKKQELASVPANARLTALHSGVADIELYDVQVDSLGAPVSGYMARPADAEQGSLPAIITLHGAGYVSASRGRVLDWASEGLLAMDINAHGVPNAQPASYYEGLRDGTLNRYWLQGRESREEFYFLGMFLRLLRAIDFLTAQPEWDGKTLILYGTSQGGAQAMAGAGLDERVSFFVAGVPAMADLTGTVVGRPMGWPNMADLTRMFPEQADPILDTLRYFDGVNFMTRTKAEGFFTVGFVDLTCRPTTVYAAYNALRNDKSIYNDIFAGHENTPEATRRMRDAVHQHVRKMQGK